MSAGNCNITTEDGGFFDITHTFKVGLSTYHVLGLRKDRPRYKNTYYIFNCTSDHHPSTNDFSSKSLLLKRPTRTSEQTPGSKRRPLTAHHTSTTRIDDTTASNRPEKPKSSSSHPRARTESPIRVETDTTVMKETLSKAMKSERQILIASFRREMNIKKRALLRSIKKEKDVLLQATTDANKQEEIIRLLEEQNKSLVNTYEQFVSATTSSIDTLKQTLIDKVDEQYNTSQSTEQRQFTLMQTIEQEVQKIVSKNEEILQSTSSEMNAISQLQDTLVEKIENYSTARERNDHATLHRLFTEQKEALSYVVEQQHTPSLDHITKAMVDALNQQQSTSVNTIHNIEHSANDTGTNVSPQHRQINSKVMTNNTIQSLPSMNSNQQSRPIHQTGSKLSFRKTADQHLFKVSIRTPEPVHVYAKLVIDGMECSRRLHTLCQRDLIQNDMFNCYIAPPFKDGPYEVTIYAKTTKETTYRAAICIRLPGSNISQSMTFPMIHQSFEEHQCILIEPLQRLLRKNEYVLIHMIVPGALVVKIRNGDENIELDENEYKQDVVKKKIRVRGDVCITGCWNKKTDSTICVFNMI